MARWLSFYFCIFTLSFFSSGCGRIWGGITWGNQTISVNVQLSVQKVYPINGSNWTYYVKNDGVDIFSGSGTACAGTETGYAACLHGGQMLEVILPGVNSCAGLSMTDSLGVFVWSCIVGSGTATFFSTDFQVGAGLQSLVSASGWNSNRVILTGANGNYSYSGQSASTTWWSNTANPVTPLTLNNADTDAPINLNVSGTIYYMAASNSSDGYKITVNHVSIVTLPGVTINYAGRNNAWCNGNLTSIICSSALNFIWVEGNYDGNSFGFTDSNGPIDLGDATINFSRVHLVTEKNSTGDGITAWLNNSIADQIKVTNNSSVGFDCQSCTNSFIKELTSGEGLSLDDVNGPNSTGDVFYQIDTADHVANEGFDIGNSTGGTFIQITASGNGDFGVRLPGSGGTITNNVLSQVTSTNNSTGGIYVAANGSGDTFNTINNFVGVNNASGILIDNVGTTNNTFSQVVVTNNTTDGIGINNGANQNFTGYLVVGSNGVKNCSVTGGTNPGVIDTTCSDTGVDGSSTYTGQLSNSVLRTARNLSSSFLGKVTTTDPANNSNVNGTATYPGAPKLFDFGNFLNLYRNWGNDGAAFPVAGNRSPWTAGTGRIWDWRISASDTQVLNRSGDGTSTNGIFIANGNCPTASYGSETGTDQWGHTYLLNAYEIVDPFNPYYSNTGNHNGLCEINEACIYTPNFGAYQGEGTFEPCIFIQNGGAVSGVSMYGYSKNGD